MRFNLETIILLLLIIYIILYKIHNQDTQMLFSFLALFLFLNYDSLLEGFDLDNSDISTNTVDKNGSERGPIIKPSSVNTGPYDGLCLKTGNREYWMKSPDETTLISNDKLYTYLSSQGPIKMKLSDQAALRGPPVDGVPGSPEKMFMWANNITSPLCCPSNFTTSTGCVCSTKNQRDFIASRGIMDIDPTKDLIKDEISN